MDTKLDDFGRDLAALTQRFFDLGAKLGEAARGLAEAGAPPSDALVEALGEGRTQFIQLRSDVLAAAGDAELASVVDPESLHDLEPILESVREALHARARRAALEDAKRQVLFTIDRVLEIVHRDDPAFATLVGAHAKAREYRAAVEALSDAEATEARQVLEDGQTFADLLTMVEDRDGLDDDRYAQLEEIVTRTYGRSLAVAIGRGRLGFVGDIVEPPPAPAPEPAAVAIEPAVAIEAEAVIELEPLAEPVDATPPLEMGEPTDMAEPAEDLETTMGLEIEDAQAPIETIEASTVRFPRLELESGGPLAAPPGALAEEFEVLPTTSGALSEDDALVDATPTIEMPPLELEPEPLAAPPPEPTPEPIAEAPAPAMSVAPEPVEESSGADTGPDETAQWWLSAWARWSGWKSSLNIADAVREEIGKYPYLLSVPIQKSPEYEDGLLAYGYSILMDHVERQKPGCVGNALNSLKASHSQPVGEQLYTYLVNEGRLRDTYAEFVRATILGAVPEPGLWFQFRILESKEDTRILQRPTARLGDPELSGQRLASEGQRYAEHKFRMTLGPLTTRFVLVSVDVKEARGIGVKIVADGAPSDTGWIVAVPAGRGSMKTEARRVTEDGTHLAGLGKDYGATWVAVFNPDPRADRRIELSVWLRKDAKSPFRSKG
jgi:hypothetical protein